MIAVVEAKPTFRSPGDGIQQSKEYAEILGLKFAYSTNGKSIVEFDYTTGKETELDSFLSPQELWSRLVEAEGITDEIVEQLLTPFNHISGKSPRYYQEIAINRAVQSVLQGKRRTLLTMATGTGKTVVAFQICWKLWNSRWNRTSEHRRPKILYLADRNILVDDPKDKIFAPFGDARWKIENGEAKKGRELYFEAYNHLEKQCETVEDRQTLQTASIFGGEAKPLPYLLAQMKTQVRGLEMFHIRKQEIDKLLFPVPAVSEQHFIVEELNHMQAKVDTLKCLQSETSDELNALLPSVLDKAFKGEL